MARKDQSGEHQGPYWVQRADKQAEIGQTADLPESCPGPKKHGSFWLKIKPMIRAQAAECKKQLSRLAL
jgi:hypothetical protein